MKSILLTTLALWALLLAPGLCIAGALEHLCADCPQATSCEHEEDCIDDPCGEVLLQPDSASSVSVPAPVVVLAPSFLTAVVDSLDPLPLSRASLLPTRENLPSPESSLPLLI